MSGDDVTDYERLRYASPERAQEQLATTADLLQEIPDSADPPDERAGMSGPRVVPGSLLHHEATELAYAIVAKAAESAGGARVLAVKGLVSDFHGLRASRIAADIDILIEPVSYAAVTSQLEAWGWRARPGQLPDPAAPHHSVTYVHDCWPCDIDAHRRFPGFLKSPDQVFDALWERRMMLTVANRHVPATDWAASVTVMALHCSRSTSDNPRHADELHNLLSISRSWTQQQRTSLANLAYLTGCVQSLGTVWSHLGVSVDPAAEKVSSGDLAEWHLRITGRTSYAQDWIRYIRAGGLSQAGTRLRAAVWPSEAFMRTHRQIPDGRWSLFAARVVRLTRSLRSLLIILCSSLRNKARALR